MVFVRFTLGMILPRILSMICILAVLPSCAGRPEVAPPAYWPTSAWRTASPESQGIDSNGLADTLEGVRDARRDVHSLLLVRHGYMVLDAAFFPYAHNDLHDMADLATVVTATLIGVAINRGDIQSVDQPVSSFFPEIAGPNSPWTGITIEHLLTMSSGLECGPGHNRLTAMRSSADWTRFALEMRLDSRPGSQFVRCNISMHLLSAILSRATGVSALDYAQAHLFGPLGIDGVIWPADSDGVTHGWGDLRIRPGDLAKIGFLYLHDGRWDGRQILSPDWVENATRAQMRIRIRRRRGYGYGWSMVPSPNGDPILVSTGRGGQRLIVWLAQDIVAVLTANGNRGGEWEPLLISAIRSDRPLPENPEALARLGEMTSEVSKPLPHSPVGPQRNMAAQISGQDYRLERNPLGLRSFGLDFVAPDLARFEMTLSDPPSTEPVNRYVLPVGLDGVVRLSSDGPLGLIAALKGEWRTDNRFELSYGEADGANHCEFTMTFERTDVEIYARCRTGMFGNHMVVVTQIGPIAGQQTGT